MASALVTVEALSDWLGQDVVEDTNLLGPLIDAVERQFLADATRSRAFQAAQTARVEVLDAPIAATIYLDYPIEQLSSVILGYDPALPDDTLDPNDKQTLVWSIGSRRIVRVDGGSWGGPRPNYLQVTYNAGADLPTDAALAIKRMAAAIYMQRGAEDSTTERIAAYESTLSKLKDDDTVWQLAVGAHRDINV